MLTEMFVPKWIDEDSKVCNSTVIIHGEHTSAPRDGNCRYYTRNLNVRYRIWVPSEHSRSSMSGNTKACPCKCSDWQKLRGI